MYDIISWCIKLFNGQNMNRAQLHSKIGQTDTLEHNQALHSDVLQKCCIFTRAVPYCNMDSCIC